MYGLEQVAVVVEMAETRGNPWQRNGCHIGAMQICHRFSTVPLPALLLWVPPINRIEGRRMLQYWLGRAGGDWRRAISAYRCGNAGLRLRCGQVYTNWVFAQLERR